MKIIRSALALSASLLAAMVSADAVVGNNDADLITSLPNFNGTIPFKQYAGRLELEAKEKLFYWYTESQNSPSEDPIVLWLNGGPGCSSMGGFWTENGPFVVRPDETVKVNRYSWNRNVNLVWLEQPAGVGFSGPLQDASYYTDDNVAEKAYEFIKLFFAKYTELQGRKFYITGESYAGIYIPFLVDLLVKTPIEGVNLTGYAIGNPFTDTDIDGNAYMDYYWSHGILSLENYDAMNKECGAKIGACMNDPTNCTASCQDAISEGMSSAEEDQFNPYYIYGDKCLLGNGQGGSLRYVKKLDPPPTHRGDIGPCADTFTEKYLRLESVQKAIHAGDQYVNWTDCNDDVSSVYTRADSALPKYRNFLSHNLSGLIYSGDADSVVNFIGTERWIGKHGLKLNIKSKWQAWFGPDEQLAGYVQEYEGLTFMTIKGAGHMVPAVKPLHGLYMFECFILGDEACATFSYPVDDEEFQAGKFLDVELSRVVAHSSLASGSLVALVAVGSAIVALVVVGYKNTQKRAEYQPINSRV
jgi:serine carboxypeptidase-like clade II